MCLDAKPPYIDVAPLHECDLAGGSFARQWHKFPYDDQVHLADFLVFLCEGGKVFAELLHQLLHALAPRVDELAHVPLAPDKKDDEVMQPRDMMGSVLTTRKEKRAQLGKMALNANCHLPEDLKLRILQYFMAGRAHFGRDHRHLSIALDASRVGLKNTVVGFLASPDNTGMWLPPQVFEHESLVFTQH